MESVLIVRTADRACALPISVVRETVRPVMIDSLPDVPDYVTGVCRIRGEPVPVVDLGRLLGEAVTAPRRLVSLSLSGRRLALAVAEVVGVRALDDAALVALPPLLGSGRADAIDWIGYRDEELLLVLDAARMIPADVWDRIGLPARV